MTTLRPPPLVLLIGADDSDGLPLSRLKESGFQIVHHPFDGDGVATTQHVRPDIVIVSIVDGNPQALDVCRALQIDARTKHIPLIAITGQQAFGQFMVTLSVRVCDPDSLHEEITRLVLRPQQP